MTPEKMLYFRSKGLREGDGVLVGSDLSQEWLLKWWWQRYRKYNQFPVAFIDFGMSHEMKNWCQDRGELIPLQIVDDFVAQKEEFSKDFVDQLESKHGKHFWNCRPIWFKKPFALLQSPFKKTIWIDIDCEVKGLICPVFQFANSDPGIAVALCRGKNRYDYPIYNSGVISFQRGNKVIFKWAEECSKNTHLHFSDDNVLSALIHKEKISIYCIPGIYNSYYFDNIENSVVTHYVDSAGKILIRQQIANENLDSILNP